MYCCLASPFLFFNHPATTEIYTLSLHDALPISNVVIEVTPRWSWTQKAVRLARNRRAKLTQTAIATLTAKRSQVSGWDGSRRWNTREAARTGGRPRKIAW